MEKRKSNTMEKYVSGILHPIVKIPDNCERLKRLCEQNTPENAAILASACDKAGNGKAFFISLGAGQWVASKREAADMYEKAKALPPPDVDVSALVEEIAVSYKENMLTQMGFCVKEKGKGYSVNSNVFASYFLKRVKLVLLGEDSWFLYNRAGYFESGSDVVVGKLIRDMLNQAVKNIWQGYVGNEILAALKLEVQQVPELNMYRELLNLENGMLNVDTGELLPHSPQYFSTVRIPFAFDPNAECPRFLQFIDEITEGDGQIASLLQELTGYLLTAEMKAEKAFLLYGSGSNGKSVFGKVIRELVGEANVSSVPLSKFSQTFGMQSLVGKTVNLAAENEVSTRVNTENFKSVVSGDKMSISIKYQPDLSYAPICKLVFLVNSLPETTDATYGFYRKLLIVPFHHKITDDEKDVDLFDKLKAEMPGILNWAIEGLRRLKANHFRFSPCEAAERTLRAYEEEQNAVPQFMADCIMPESGERISRSRILLEFRQWLMRNGMENGYHGDQQFWRGFKLAAENAGITYRVVKIKGVRYMADIRFTDEITQPDDTFVPIT